MMRLIVPALLFSTIASGALADPIAPPKKHLLIFRTEQGARLHCPDDTIVWASTASHALYLPGNNHYGHTHGGFACKLEARARGYRGPTSHA